MVSRIRRRHLLRLKPQPHPMANFQTHLNVGIVVSAATTLSLHMAGLIAGAQTMPLFTLGVVGSLLPDIDADAS